jgi:hypothetical protein
MTRAKPMQEFIQKDVERFARYSMPEPMSGCWLWSAHADAKGYGYMRIGNTKVGRGIVSTHRFSYTLHKGAIPDGLVIDHLCRNPNCCNPDHLEPVTSVENVMRGEGFAARKARQTVCHKGHEFTHENTYVNRRGHRVCRACMREHERVRYARDRQRDRVKVVPQCGTRGGYTSGCRCSDCKAFNTARCRGQKMKKLNSGLPGISD